MKYKVGDRVRIVDIEEFKNTKCRNAEGLMDEWAGKIMTIREVLKPYYYMYEDRAQHIGPGWCWYEDMIAGPAEESYTEFITRKIEEATKLANQQWNEEHVMVELVHGVHKIHGKQYTWQNPKKIAVEIGEIVEVETNRGRKPVIVTGKVDKLLKDAKEHKQVIGRY